MNRRASKAAQLALELDGVTVTFASSPILDDVSLRLGPGWHGLVGANGAGKTTLLRVLAGALAPGEGAVRREPRDAAVVVVPQEVDAAGVDVHALGESEERLACELRGRLALDPAELARWATLSPGERKRWQIGAALAAEPEVLLLDEPTNHLDVEGRTLLLGALRRFRGVGVVVSHDRALLDELTAATLRVHHAQVTAWPGSYSAASEAWELERRESEDAHHRARDQVKAARGRLAAARQERAEADAGRSARSRMRNEHDSDARGMGATTLAAWAEARSGRTVGVRRAELERAEAAVPTFERDRTLGGSIFAAYARPTSSVLFHVDADAIGPDGITHAPPPSTLDRPVILRDVRLTLGRDERVRVVGPNGAGKTTLLRALLRGGPPPARTLYLPQELAPETVVDLAAELRAAPPEERGRILAVFAALGSDPERVLFRRAEDAARLSPGEARKLALATGLGRHAWALVLDEPTNHLDLPSIERLERALAAYPGAIVLVTHDDAFASSCTTRALRVPLS